MSFDRRLSLAFMHDSTWIPNDGNVVVFFRDTARKRDVRDFYIVLQADKMVWLGRKRTFYRTTGHVRRAIRLPRKMVDHLKAIIPPKEMARITAHLMQVN